MNRSRAAAAYQSAMMTTPPLQSLVLLYDGLLVRLHNAEAAAVNGDYETQFTETERAVRILRGLLATLDLRRGGVVAVRLQEAYVANMRALLHAVGRRDGAECCRRVAEGLRELRDAWAEIAGLPPIGASGQKP